jgi:magnesium-transporting ATPase (P-type)
MSTILTEIEDNEFRYDKRLHVKGAAEIVLSACSHYLDKDGVRRELSNELKNKIVAEVIEEFARGALRTI